MDSIPGQSRNVPVRHQPSPSFGELRAPAAHRRRRHGSSVSRPPRGFGRDLAIKLIKRGMDTDSVLRRFHNERRILETPESSQHRQDTGRRRHSGGAAVFRHGATSPAGRSASIAISQALRSQRGSGSSRRSAPRCSALTNRTSCTAISSRRTSWSLPRANRNCWTLGLPRCWISRVRRRTPPSPSSR